MRYMMIGENRDPARSLLQRLIDERGCSAAWVSHAIRKNHAYIHQYLVQGKPAVLPRSARIALGRLFGIDPEALLNGRLGIAIDPRRADRARIATDRLIGWLPESRQFAPEISSAIYVLLERDDAGERIRDDEDTLEIIRELIVAIRRKSFKKS
jgi:hypothetical protein